VNDFSAVTSSGLTSAISSRISARPAVISSVVTVDVLSVLVLMFTGR
jgi:hypothetical protein